MRTPIVTVAVITAAVLSPTLSSATPIPGSHTSVAEGGPSFLEGRSLVGLGFNEILSRREPNRQNSYSSSGWTMNPKKFWKKAVGTYSTYVSHIYAKPDEPHPTFPPFSMTKRVDDGTTQGGNAHTGNSGNVFGGSVHNTDTTNNQNMPVLMNMNSNNAGRGGKSKAGCAASGKSSTKGIGGNASSGDSGEAYGGDVDGPPSGMVNVNSNNAGGAGDSETGCAVGGDSVDHSSQPGPGH
ncbi:hypothetical protein NLI96_g6326 [Meripilus lineatus]|uniref:Uncharacterized protein n=1 Tax=Meripilus lineatus TaxID=2056292 RepID=A0AAD5YI84_9APHY|nr:hypothetical protein NLI96_g6326 [Physisporinus lineatus]